MKKRILSIFLCFSLLLVGIPMSVGATSYEYVLKPSTVSDANSNFAKLVGAKLAAHGATDEVTVYVSNEAVEGALAQTPHWMAWPSKTYHAATVTVTSNPGEGKTTLYHKSGDGNIDLFGNTVFTNLKINLPSDDRFIDTLGHNLTIDDTVDISYGGYSHFAKIAIGGIFCDGGAIGTNDGVVTLDGKSIEGGVVFGAGRKGKQMTIKGNQTLISKNNSIKLYFAGLDVTTFSKNINIVLENAKITSVSAKYSDLGSNIVKGAVQILANGTSSLNATDVYNAAESSIEAEGGIYLLDSSNQSGTVSLTDVVGTYAVESDCTYAYAYDSVNNGTIIYYGTDVLTLTNPGNYKIGYANSLEEITANLEGEWFVNTNGTITRGSKIGSYYVDPKGSGDGRTKENPAKTIKAVVDTINSDGFTTGDTATVYVTGGEGVSTWSDGTLASYTVNYKVEHTAKLIITSIDASNRAKIAYDTKASASAPLVVKGPTVFKNIDLVDSNGWKEAFTNANDVTFENVKFLKPNGASLVNDSSKLYLGSSYNAGTLGDYDSTVNIDGTVSGISTVIFGGFKSVDRAEVAHDMTLSLTDYTLANLYLSEAVTHAMTYNGDINVILNNAKISNVRVTNDSYSPVFNGAIQFVVNNGATLPNLGVVETYVAENNIPYFVMDSSAATQGALATTEIAGTYKVKSDCKYAYAYNVKQPDVIFYGTDSLTVNGEGSYVVGYTDDLTTISTIIAGNWFDNGDGTMTRYPDGVKIGKYYVAPNGTGDGRTPETPAKAITKVMKSIVDDQYSANDYVIIYVSGGEGATNLPSEGLALNYAWPWPTTKGDGKGDDVTTPANVTITSLPGAKAPATLEFGGGDFTVMSNTVFKNITLLDKKGKYGIYTNGYNVTFDEDVTFKKGETNLSDYTPEIKIGVSYNAGVRCDVDGTLTINNNSGNKKYSIYYGGYSWDGADGNEANSLNGDKTVVINGGSVEKLYLLGFKRNAEYASDINVVLNGAKLKAIGVSSINGYAPVIDGAIQFVINNGASLPDMSAIKTYADTNNIPYYVLNASNTGENLLTTTSQAGEYAVMEGYVAVAIDDNDSTKQYPSENGILSVPAGEYSVSKLDNSIPYICDGKTITVYVPTKIDFSTVIPDTYSVEDKVFIGWKIQSTGEYATSDMMLNIGDVLEAQYIDCTADDFGVSTEIRTVGKDGLRFIVNVSNSFFNALPNAGEKGSIVIPTNNARGRDIFIDEAVIYDWTWDEETRMNFTANETGETPVAVKAVNMFESVDDLFKYTLCITDIAEENYDRYYTMRGYIKYVDYNGVERVAYTSHANTSLYHTAVDTIDSVLAPSIKAKIQAIIDCVDITLKTKTLNASKQLLAGYEGCADNNPNHKLYYQNGVYVREVSINSGRNLSSPITIAAFSDLHLNHINMRDIEEGRDTILSTYRGRLWNKNGNTVGYTNTTINLAKYHDKAIVVGDIMDYLSWGCADVMQRALIDKFTKNKLTMVLGNHEQTEILEADMGGLSNTLTDKEIDEWLYKYWINDMYYTSEIMKDNSGNDGVMIVTMMNGWDEYNESQRVALEADIATAKSKNIPILIFQHNPICTRNPNESKYPVIADRTKFGTEENNTKYLDMQNEYAGNVSGNKGSDAITLSVYDLIVQNHDVIKGVFHAHKHLHMYTEIMAQDKNGNFISDGNGGYVTIPQYGMFSVADSGGAMISVTVN